MNRNTSSIKDTSYAAHRIEYRRMAYARRRSAMFVPKITKNEKFYLNSINKHIKCNIRLSVDSIISIKNRFTHRSRPTQHRLIKLTYPRPIVRIIICDIFTESETYLPSARRRRNGQRTRVRRQGHRLCRPASRVSQIRSQ